MLPNLKCCEAACRLGAFQTFGLATDSEFWRIAEIVSLSLFAGHFSQPAASYRFTALMR
jgi:hypothetical protein